MTKIHTALLGLAVVAVVVGRTVAQDDEQFLRAAFARLDADGDGMLLRKEFPGSDRQFTALDGDKDGKASFAEFRDSDVGKSLLRARYRNKAEAHPRTTFAELAPLRLQWLLRIDANKDGRVTRAEWNGSEEAFLQLDLDGNGVLDKRDRLEAEAAAPPPAPELPEPKGEVLVAEAALQRYDKDRDGKLAGKELAADKWLLAALPWADKNTDGALDERELRALADAVLRRRMDAESARQRPVAYDVPFDAWDADKDGKVRQNEWQGPGDLFAAIDFDRDAGVSRDEVVRYKKRVLGEDFVARFDLDGDGKVTLAEFGGPPGAFARTDKNGDGVVTRADK